MREVEVSQFVDASPETVHSVLTPAEMVAAEGTFTVADVTETDEGTVVSATGPGMMVPLQFRTREDGLSYVADDEVGPFEHLETTVTVEPEGDGSRLRMRSAVSLNLPLPFADRLATWKRRGELERALESFVEAVD